MEMEKIFLGEKERIQEMIEKIEPEKCIIKFFDYLNYIHIDNQIERRFHSKLIANEKKLYKIMMLEFLKDKSIDELKELLIEAYGEGTIRYNEADYEDVSIFIRYHISDEDACPIIKKFMKECYDEVIEESKKSEKEKEIEKIKAIIKRHEEGIKSYEKIIERNKEKIEKIYKEI